jgi:hypothetical protein
VLRLLLILRDQFDLPGFALDAADRISLAPVG